MTKVTLVSAALITGEGIHKSGHGYPQRCRGTAGQGPYERYRLCAGSGRERVCLGSLYCTPLHAQYRY